MDREIVSDEFARKVMAGLQLAIKKVYQEAGQNKRELVISVNGQIRYVYPKEDGSISINE
jgi:hypothetical protein